MAIGRITGQMLSANLSRSGTDLAFETTLLVLDVTNSRVGVGTASPATTLHISATDALRLPSGTTGQRPGSPANGDIRYNSTTSTIEGYSNGAYANLASGTSIEDADDDEVRENTRELLKLCNIWLSWLISDNIENQKAAYEHLDFFFDTLNDGIDSALVISSIITTVG